MKKILVLGGGGFIGGHLSKRLKDEGHFVRVVDIKNHEYFNENEFLQMKTFAGTFFSILKNDHQFKDSILRSCRIN